MARIYIELYSSLLIHKVVDGDEGRIYSLSDAVEAETKIPLPPPTPFSHPLGDEDGRGRGTRTQLTIRL